ncbi:tRNA1(Val) (adenine(37)-N6)-methyltransferase [Micavibrio aeruginosavorus]|uniref:tRNA (Adenine37-N(6)-)-methyltransferase TrmN6 n=1 Tax=Micavibrio aeruginosavorus EPB TaxID=349215 RepID=M4VGZ7_9BACT|nr:methyltransferase domain-containing protein [Micavibrio aeruginosavorus]AGH98463.1 tRNA (adenine37-N(6)-)-methyltransferase TrmN6 [Micavibrio aeruginosavorus EPB]
MQTRPEPEEIYVLNQSVRLLQPGGGGFRTSLDSVMLAAACPAKAGDRVLDLGCGVGGAIFCVLKRLGGVFGCGIEIQDEYIELAGQNAALNNNTDRCEFAHGDISQFEISDLKQRFDHVIFNPPFMEAGTWTPSPDTGRATALGHADVDLDIGVWVDCAFRNLKSGGSMTIIHRADRTDEIIQAMCGRTGNRRFGAVEIFPLWPRMGQAAKRVVIRAVKDRKTPATIHAGLVLHEANGDYTEKADAVLRNGERLF